MVTLYGIKNCDTIKKARRWLDARGVKYVFHDLRADGLEQDVLCGWMEELGCEVLLNRRGTTWRKLPDELKNNVDDDVALRIMLDNPAVIKRPVLDMGNQRKVGFTEDDYAQYFQSSGGCGSMVERKLPKL